MPEPGLATAHVSARGPIRTSAVSGAASQPVAASRSQSDGDIRRGTDLPRAAEAAACAAGKGRRVRALRRIAGTQERRRFVQIFKASKPHR